MAQQKEDVGSYEEFRTNVLPRIAADGYNAIQIMAIQEHVHVKWRCGASTSAENMCVSGSCTTRLA